MTQLLQEYLGAQAERRSEAVALVGGAVRLTYGELEAQSNRLAHALVDAGAGPGERICLFSEKSPAAVCAMLAVLKAGCMYVPIDVASPAARVARIVKAADPCAALVSAGGSALLRELQREEAATAELRIVALDDDVDPEVEAAFGPQALAAASAQRPQLRRTAGDGAHILFTSGSTGEPKGVLITHANVVAFVDWGVRYFGFGPGDRHSGHPPLHFDLSTFDVFGAFAAGAELHLVPPDLLLPSQLSEFVINAELTQWFSVPSAMAYMARFGGLPADGFPTVKRVLWCGEVLPTPVLVQWMKRLPHARFTNLYGPTEATIASSYYTIPDVPGDEGTPIPIGTPCPGEELVVLDEHGNELEADEIGELHIGGAGLSPGYWRDEERTRAAFIADPRPGRTDRLYRTGDLARRGRDGLFHFLGRADSQIKSRGYRIELGEIESALNNISGIAECAVVAVDADGFAGSRICCAFAPTEHSELSPVAVRTALRRALPSYMVPSSWQVMSTLPKNVNGKIDRRALREFFASAAEGSTAR